MVAGLTLAVGLFALITLEMSSRLENPPASPAKARIAIESRDGAREKTGVADRRQAWLKEILARPLFSPDRRPVEVGVRGLPRLAGIVLSGSRRLAIFAAPSGHRAIVAEAGAHVGAYEVRTIAADGVTVVGPEGTSLIRPVFGASQPPAPGPPRARPLPRLVKPVSP